MMKFFHTLVAPVSLLVLAACSSNPSERSQANGDFNYVDSELISGWKILDDAQPQFYTMYDVPGAQFKGDIGKELDIRPPQQLFNLIPGARIDKFNNGAIMWLTGSEQMNRTWALTLAMLAEEQIPYEERDSGLVTDWISLSDMEDQSITGRYRIDRIEQDGNYGVYVGLFELRENGQPAELVPAIETRYSAVMMNKITGEYDKALQEEARQRALEELNQVPVVMGRDQSGLPIIVARADFDLVWSRLEKTLPMMGFGINDKSQSQGIFETSYSRQSDDEWAKYGLAPLEWDNREYDFLIGDLGNRTSINVTDSQGQLLDMDTLQLLMPTLEVLLDNNTVNQASQ